MNPQNSLEKNHLLHSRKIRPTYNRLEESLYRLKLPAVDAHTEGRYATPAVFNRLKSPGNKRFTDHNHWPSLLQRRPTLGSSNKFSSRKQTQEA